MVLQIRLNYICNKMLADIIISKKTVVNIVIIINSVTDLIIRIIVTVTL